MSSISSIFFLSIKRITIFTMAQLNALGLGVINFYVQWPDDATLSLIQYRRFYQNDFSTTSVHDQKPIWQQIAQNINNDHPNFAPSKKQCRNK